MRNIFFVDAAVGLEVLRWIASNHADHVGLVVCTAQNDIHAFCLAERLPVTTMSEWTAQTENGLKVAGEFDFGFLIWWPSIVKESVLATAKSGFFNTHPSLLPHGRGKHPNFWAIVEETPFGVSIHQVTPGIDDGAVVGQRELPVTWEDTGETLYQRGLGAMIELFPNVYQSIVAGEHQLIEQEAGVGSFHLSKQLEPASRFDINAQYRARDLLNLIRARTFAPHPATSFVDNGSTYEVRISIKRRGS
ncbi:formyltransferase family protein [Pleomorphomonas sp. JP5]|uniref:formyltransferase family protein n=1 Tax=Pleomorphomonas sp. JP5 TaxID=2942998 RepID=UPI002043C76B|nr:formyltransferase family protein [Pleomorphomonas sp. JP5]MCM5557657.1 hypothetical protein [Pleomorphomonas sp. JP5]